MKKYIFRQIFSWFSIASLLLQVVTPFSSLIPQAYAQTVTPTDTAVPTIDTSSPTPTNTVTPTDTSTPTPTDTIAPSPTPTDTVTPTPTDTTTPTDTITPTPGDTGTPTATPTDTVAPTQDNSGNNSSQGPPPATPTDSISSAPTVIPTVTPDTPPVDTKGQLNATILKNVSAPSLNLTTTQTSSATLTTDKADYAPTDTAIISGSGFTPNHTYSLTISSTDNPPTSTTVQVTTDDKGNFVYAYQLDGKYRPNYSVVVVDASTTIATTSFTDSAPYSSQTVVGACMTTDQKGHNVSCVSNDTSLSTTSQPTIIGDGATFADATNSINGLGCQYPGDYVKFTTNWQIQTNATQRYNLGLWFASAGQVNVTDGGQCSITSLPSSPSPFFESNTDTCGDINSSGTGGIPVTMVAICNPDNSGLLKLPYCTSWSNNDNACTGPTQTLPDTTSHCSCNSGFTIPVIIPPSIEVLKVLNPASDSGKFNLLVNSTPKVSNVGNGGDTGKVTATTGSNTFGETAGTNTLLSNYSSSASCVLRGTTTSVSITGTGPTWTIPSVTNGQDIVCTITNNRSTGTIELKKVWSGTGGQTTLNIGSTANGTDVASQLTGAAGAAPLTTGTKTVNSGTYFVSESGGLANYTPSLACTDNGTPVAPGINNSVSATPGHAVICTFTNTLQQAHLTLVKTVTNDNGGSAVATAWTLSATGNTTISGSTGSVSVTNAGVLPGTYTLSESGGPGGYTGSTYSCVKNGGGAVISNSITLANGDSATCTINNNDNAPSLTLVKVVSNTHGGTATASAWTLTATGASGSPTNLSGTTPVNSGSNFKADTYTLAESGGPSGYTASLWTCTNGITVTNSQITLGLGQSTICTITNSDIAPTLKLTKIVSNTHGGTATPVSWTMTATGSSNSFSDAGNSTTFHAVTGGIVYTLTESGPTGYTAGSWSCDVGSLSGNQLTLGVGQNATCSITNSDIGPTLKLSKIVVNNSGGTSTPHAWTLTATGSGGFSDFGDSTTFHSVTAGVTYTLSETGTSGYSAGSWSCSAGTLIGNQITLGVGQTNVTCSITNTDVAPTLKLVKSVTNDNGGTNVPHDWTLTATGNGGFSDFGDSTTFHSVLSNTTYTLSESGPAGYNPGSWGCSAGTLVGSQLTLVPGQTNVICTITNNDNAPSLTLVKVVSNTHGGTATASAWTLTATGPTTISGAGGVTSGSTFSAGTYTLSESTGPSGYAAGSWECTNGFTVTNNQISIGVGQSTTCTITNSDVQPKLTVTKVVVNQAGSTGQVSDFPLFVNTTSVTSGVQNGFDAGTYTVSETNQAGYTGVITGDCASNGSVTLHIGDVKACTITNTRNVGSIQVAKIVSPSDAGVTGWDFTISGPTNNTASNIHDGGQSSAFVSATGSYTVSEAAHTGTNGNNYTSTYSCTDGINSLSSGSGTTTTSFTLNTGKNIICTFTNSIKKGTIIVKKTMVGGTGSFTFTGDVAGTISTNNGTLTTSNVLPGTYASVEGAATGWDLTGLSCDDGQSTTPSTGNTQTRTATFHVDPGETVTCTFTNSKQPILTVIKTVISDNGGTATASSFTVHVLSSGTDVAGSPQAGSATGTAYTLEPATYTVTENDPTPLGYAQTSIVCDGQTTSSITLSFGDSKSCTITNNDIAPQLIVKKHVVNTHGGTLSASNFSMFVNDQHNSANPAIFGGDENGTTVTLNAGTYTAGEITQPGYTESASADCTGSITVGQVKTCTITNSDQPATLIVTKHVINDNGGTKSAADFTMQVTGTNVSNPSFAGAENPGTSVTLNAGSYSVDEGAHDGYTNSLSTDCSGTIANGETKTCTITNDDIAPSLTLTKVVHNTNGGTALATDWTLSATGSGKNPTNLSGTTPVTSDNTFKADTYTLAESNGPSGYSASGWSCTNGVTVTNSQITLTNGQTTTCTITNSDIAPTLKLVKLVTNNNGGTNVPADWTLGASGTSGFTDTGNSTTFHTVLANTTYSLSESGPAGYDASTWSCDGGSLKGSSLTLNLNQNVTCTITNDDIAPSLTLVKLVDNQNVGTAAATDFTLSADGPTPISGAGGAVSGPTFSQGTYTLSETGPSGYTASAWGCVGGSQKGNQITLGLNDSAICTITNTRDTGSVIVHKAIDILGDGTFTTDDATAKTLGFSWSLDGSGTNDFGSSVNGISTLNTHSVNENLNSQPYHFVGWYPTSSKDFSCANPESATLPANFSLGFNGDSRDITLCNARNTGRIRIGKVVEDASGKVVTTDPTLFTFNINAGQTVEDTTQLAGGQSNSFVLPTGNYTVTENIPNAGYDFLGCHAFYDEGEIGNVIPNGENVTVFTNETVNVVCTNQQKLPVLTITKTNNKIGINQAPGDSVVYTITVTATQSSVLGTTVTDLLPKGFHYRAGSWTANSDVRGDLKALGITTEPTYHSPGTWQLGNMAQNETVTLTLIADIDSGQQPGDYKDTAWTQGESLASTEVLGNANTGVFVGTDVNVVTTTTTGATFGVSHTVTQQVLGASTILPATGANSWWIFVASVLMTLGLTSMGIGFIIRKRYV